LVCFVNTTDRQQRRRKNIATMPVDPEEDHTESSAASHHHNTNNNHHHHHDVVDGFSNSKRFALADLLRDCAVLVEENKMDSNVFQSMFVDLTTYVQSHKGRQREATAAKAAETAAKAAAAAAKAAAAEENEVEATANVAVAASGSSEDAPEDEKSSSRIIPGPAKRGSATGSNTGSINDDPTVMSRTSNAVPNNNNNSNNNDNNTNRSGSHVHGTSARRVKTTTTTTTHIPPPASSTSSRSRDNENNEGVLSKDKAHNFLGKLKNTAKDVGHEFTHIAHTGQRKLSEAAKTATSTKNAQRAKHDIAAEFNKDVWCEEHFTMGCHCKLPARSERSESAPSEPKNKRPPFQRPINPSSTLIANGWLEQQRRSKMRVVWKEVLVSLVAGRRPGEETTLWVQRETTNPVTGTTGLEALHQIPIKGMQDINYVDFSADHRFVIRVFNLNDEFVFRTNTSADAAKNWVSTLRLTREAILNGVAPPKAGDLAGSSKRSKHYPGYSEDEKKAESPPQVSVQRQQSSPMPPPQQQQQPPKPQQSQSQQSATSQSQQSQQSVPQHPHTSKRLSIKELRAIANGYNISTAGMERGELEACVARIQQQEGGRATPHPPSGPPPPPSSGSRPTTSSMSDDSLREAQRLAREELQRAERLRQVKADEATAARFAAEEANHARTQSEAEERRRAEYLRQQEVMRQQQAAQAVAARQKWEEEQRKAQQAAEEQRRRYQQQQQQQQYQQQQQHYAQQQAQWNQQQKQWQQQQQQQAHQQNAQQGQMHTGAFPHSHQQPQYPHSAPPPGQQPPHNGQRSGPPPPQGGAAPNKWANMAANEEADSGQAAITKIKHEILVKWALQAPAYQMLRSIDALLISIHSIFPPASGVAGHDYFKKWKAVSVENISGDDGRLDENKLSKSVKKLRFFLHPDKLPRDLSDEQTFVCKMLWDITSDAWEEYEKHKEDLDWLG